MYIYITIVLLSSRMSIYICVCLSSMVSICVCMCARVNIINIMCPLNYRVSMRVCMHVHTTSKLLFIHAEKSHGIFPPTKIH